MVVRYRRTLEDTVKHISDSVPGLSPTPTTLSIPACPRENGDHTGMVFFLCK